MTASPIDPPSASSGRAWAARSLPALPGIRLCGFAVLLLVLFGSAFAVGRASGPLQPGIRPTDPGPSGGDHDMPGMRHDMPGMDHDMPGMEDMPGMTMSGLGPLRSSSAAAGTAPAPARQVRR